MTSDCTDVSYRVHYLNPWDSNPEIFPSTEALHDIDSSDTHPLHHYYNYSALSSVPLSSDGALSGGDKISPIFLGSLVI